MPIPIVDLSPFVAAPAVPGRGERRAAADALRHAARRYGFFYCVGHGVPSELSARLEDLATAFFAQELERKLEISMVHGGRAWRGYFPVGQELTSGRPDQKEGLYFGTELCSTHPKVLAGTPLHGPNLFPDVPGFREAVLEYLDALTGVGHRLMEVLALSLGLDAEYFAERYTRDPLTLFRIFHYPPLSPSAATETWGVGEHTDYGLLTVLAQDSIGGLEVRTRHGWVDAPPIPGAFVCNLGDMLERMTSGFYRSTPHRVRNVSCGTPSSGTPSSGIPSSGIPSGGIPSGGIPSGGIPSGGIPSRQGRLSFPFFFDPAFDAQVEPVLFGDVAAQDAPERWDGRSVHELSGTYGEYLLGKIGKVFPGLGDAIL